MWLKRPRGQIAKCAAAQALRLAFPEGGAQPTAEEMEGKALDEDYSTVVEVKTVPAVVELTTWPEDKFAERLPKWMDAIRSGKTVDGVITAALTKGVLTDDQMAQIKALPAQIVKEAGQRQPEGRTGPMVVTYAQVADALNKAPDMDKLNDAATMINYIDDAAQHGELEAIFDRRSTEIRG